ncbi:hypothetical protein BC827DRAFT_1220622 [Russula dissimulans]|nr:hypothetical protein BC827DRAFT_1220622 [Russula dissimulans]
MGPCDNRSIGRGNTRRLTSIIKSTHETENVFSILLVSVSDEGYDPCDGLSSYFHSTARLDSNTVSTDITLVDPSSRVTDSTSASIVSTSPTPCLHPKRASAIYC